jgi:hypothetical protein
MLVKCNLRISCRIMYVVTDTYKVPSQIPDRPNGCLAVVFPQPRLNFLCYVATLGADKLRYMWKVVSCCPFEWTNNSITDHSDHAVEVMGLRPLTCWDFGFESTVGLGLSWVGHSSRGVPPSVVCPMSVIAKPHNGARAMTRNRVKVPQGGKKITAFVNRDWDVLSRTSIRKI